MMVSKGCVDSEYRKQDYVASIHIGQMYLPVERCCDLLHLPN